MLLLRALLYVRSSYTLFSFGQLMCFATDTNNYSISTITNQFCLDIILCRAYSSFDYLIYPYYPAYTD